MATKLELSDRLDEISARNDGLSASNSHLKEQLSQVMAMLRAEDRDWLSLIGRGEFEHDGFSLDDLKEWSVKINESRYGNPHIGRGFRARASYIWKDGIRYRNVPSKGVKNVQKYIDLPLNQEQFFGADARRKREACLFSDSIAIYFGEDSKKTLRAIPLHEITADVRNPDYADEIWGYRRTWERFNFKTGKSETQNEWVMTDRFAGLRPTHIGKNNERYPVAKGKTAFDLVANGAVGFAYGAPDALAAVIWSKIVRDLYMDGVTMTHALATFAFKSTHTSEKGRDNAQLALADGVTPGSTAQVGGVNDLVPMSSAGKGYDFDSFRGVIAIVATSLDVSVIALTSDPGTAGSSYGSAQVLDLPTRLAMESRREEHIALDERVLRWMGAENAEAFFIAYDDATEGLRRLQAILIKWGTGLYEPKELKAEIEDEPIERVTVPTGVMLPNNEKSLARRDIDVDGKPKATDTGFGQGATSQSGATTNSNDIRTDLVSQEAMAAFVREELARLGLSD